MLDWTTRSFVACYFAASSANFEFDGRQKIAIWALDTTYADSWKAVNVISPPGGTSQNQAAQSGLFTMQKLTVDFSDKYQEFALEDVDEIYSITGSCQPLMKITLPLEEAPEVLKLCAALGVDGSTLFPGYHGVAKMVRDWANVLVGVRLSPTIRDAYQNEWNGE
jgi:hypothetical protein